MRHTVTLIGQQQKHTSTLPVEAPRENTPSTAALLAALPLAASNAASWPPGQSAWPLGRHPATG